MAYFWVICTSYSVDFNSKTLFLHLQTGPVVQLNRTSDSGSESRRFESCRGR